jgi:hypothetical protein
VKIHKTVTEKVIAANRANGQKNAGPRDTSAVRHNAVKHGLLAKHLVFQSEEEKIEFDALLNDLEDEYKPAVRTEFALVEEIAVCLWKLQTANGWEVRELANRRKAARAILRAVAENYREDELPLFTEEDGSDSAARLGWDCEELIVRTGTRKSEQEQSRDMQDKTDKTGQVHIEAKLHNSMESVLRYETSLKRDLYRVIAVLRDIQRERRAQDFLTSDISKKAR